MPELPEVETVKNGLSPKIIGQTISSAFTSSLKMRIQAPKNILKMLENKKIIGVERRSKYLYIHLHSKYSIIIHLGMSGSLTMQMTNSDHKKHDHLVLELTDLSLHFNDPRRFGFYDVQQTEVIKELKYIKKLGFEPLNKEFNVRSLTEIVNKTTRPIKSVIMDASLVVGIGNIYACEGLFSAGISPFTPSCKLSKLDINKLYKSIVDTLNRAIEAGGSTLKDHKQADGTLGYFQHTFKVYGKANDNCTVCNTNIIREIQGGRSSFYCPNCQPKK